MFRLDPVKILESVFMTLIFGIPLIAFLPILKSFCAGFIIAEFYLLFFRIYRKMR